MKTEVNIRKFTDYRTFLVAYAQEMKTKKPEWSYGAWARHLGLKATSSITKIVNGEREPGEQITEQLVRYFRFNEKEAEYFRDLVRLSKIRQDPRLSVLLLEKMSKEHPHNAHKLLDGKTFSVISNWYYLPLREMIRMAGFHEDPEWIAKKFRFDLTARDVTKAIRTMLDLGLLRRSERGQLEICEGRVATSDDVADEGIKRYHEQMIENAKGALRSVDVAEREFTASSLVIRTSNLPKAKELIREFRKNFARLMEEDAGDAVYQIQIQLFPLTKPQNLNEKGTTQ